MTDTDARELVNQAMQAVVDALLDCARTVAADAEDWRSEDVATLLRGIAAHLSAMSETRFGALREEKRP